jgi:hypothetical protein
VRLRCYLRIRYFRNKHCRFNPLQPTPNCALNVWLQTISAAFTTALYRLAASFFFVVEMLVQTHKKLAEAGRFPTLRDLLQRYYRFQPKSPDEAGYKSGTARKLKPLLGMCPEPEYEVGFDPAYLVKHHISLVLDLPDEEDVPSFFILYVIMYTFC